MRSDEVAASKIEVDKGAFEHRAHDRLHGLWFRRHVIACTGRVIAPPVHSVVIVGVVRFIVASPALAPPKNIELSDLLSRSISKPRPEKRNLQLVWAGSVSRIPLAAPSPPT